MESDGTYMSDHQLFFLSDSYPKRQLLIIMGIEGDVVSCLYNHVITHNLWNSSNVYCVLFIFICFSVSSSILCGILPLSSLIPNIFSKEFLSLRH